MPGASDVHPSSTAFHGATRASSKELAALGILSGGHWQSRALATSIGRAECATATETGGMDVAELSDPMRCFFTAAP